MERVCIITRYVPVNNYAALGYAVYAVLMTVSNMTTEKEDMLFTFFNRNEHILWAVKVIGRYNVLAYVCVKKEEEYHDTINQLRMLLPEQITRLESLSAHAEYKYTYLPDCVFERNLK